jgi:hypothetical protein
MFLSIDLTHRRVVPLLPEAAPRVAQAAAAHAGQPRPVWAGRHIALPPAAALS